MSNTFKKSVNCLSFGHSNRTIVIKLQFTTLRARVIQKKCDCSDIGTHSLYV